MKKVILGALFVVVTGLSACVQVNGHVRGDTVASLDSKRCDVVIKRDVELLPDTREEIGVLHAESTEFAIARDLEQEIVKKACAADVDALLVLDEGYHDLTRGSWMTVIAYATP